MPDKLIEEGLKQPDWIKVSFEKGTNEISGHVAPDQAWFGAEYFLAYTLPDFESKILTQLLDSQKDNGPLLFSFLGQCFQKVGLTEWTSVVEKWCPDDADCMKANFDKCIRDYLEAVAGFPNIGNQLICLLCTAKNPILMPMHEFMQRWVKLLSYYPRRKRKVNKSSSHSLRPNRTSLPTWTRGYLPTRSEWLPSSSSVKLSTKRLAFLRRLPRTRSSQRKRVRLMFLPHVAMNRATSSTVATNIVITIKATNVIATIADLIFVIKTINPMVGVDADTRTQGTTSHTTRRMIASAITSRKRATRPCTMASPLCQAPAICPEKELILISFALLLLFLLLKQQELQKPSCRTTWLQAKHSMQTQVFVLQGWWWWTLPSPRQEQ